MLTCHCYACMAGCRRCFISLLPPVSLYSIFPHPLICPASFFFLSPSKAVGSDKALYCHRTCKLWLPSQGRRAHYDFSVGPYRQQLMRWAHDTINEMYAHMLPLLNYTVRLPFELYCNDGIFILCMQQPSFTQGQHEVLILKAQVGFF